MKCYLIVALICVSLMIIHVENVFMCFTGHLYIFGEVYLQVLCPFFNWVIWGVLLLSCKSSLYILNIINSLLDIWFANIFPTMWTPFSLCWSLCLLLFVYLFIFKSLLNLLQYCFCSVFWFFSHKACGILAPRPGIEPTPPALEGKVLINGPPGKSL